MSAFFDIHHHFLYGLDDGAATKLEMQQMLVEAQKDGIRVILATPHITPGSTPISMELLQAQMEEARRFSQSYGLDLELHLGSEIFYTYHVPRFLSERLLPTMAGTDKVLLEFAPNVTFSEVEDAVLNVLRAGYLPILAHIERYACLMFARQHLDQLKKEYEVFFQINADCILRGRDYVTNRTIKRAILEGSIDFVATDAHNTHRRGSNLQKAYDKLESVYGTACADRLLGNHQSFDWFDKL